MDLLANSAKSASTRKSPTIPAETPQDDLPLPTTVVAQSEVERDLANPYRSGQTRAPSATRWPAPSMAGASSPNLDVAHMRTRTVVPATDAKVLACEGPLAIVPGGTCARVPVMLGPFVVTDVFAPGGCGDQLFVSTGSDGSQGWIMFNAAVMTLSLHGMQLVVQPDEKLYVGARAEKGVLRSDALRCTVTLSGWRPDALE